MVELGASGGRRLAALVDRSGCAAVAVEPSARAIEAGSLAYPHIRYVRGTVAASNLPAGETFDLVILNYVLHWVDRATLEASYETIERITAPAGLLVLGDFMPCEPHSVEYHHLRGQGLCTYKEDYPGLILARGGWELVALLTGNSKSELHPHVTSRERSGWALLRRLGEVYEPGAMVLSRDRPFEQSTDACRADSPGPATIDPSA